jgi:ABC-2 type transport system permease protein
MAARVEALPALASTDHNCNCAAGVLSIRVGFGLGPVFKRAGEGSYLQFMAPGLIGMTVLFSSVFSGVAILWDRQFGFLKETLVAPVPCLYVMIGRTLGGATVATIQGFLDF